MDKDIIAKEVNAEYLKGFIYYVRDVRVMLDMDLAKIYGYSTKDFNRQVKNSIEKFEQDFMFQLTNEECEILRCKNSTSSWGGRRYNPYAFTEQGIYMLMTVLKGELATSRCWDRGNISNCLCKQPRTHKTCLICVNPYQLLMTRLPV